MGEKLLRKRLTFEGLVQGVGFRWRARHAAEAVGATGWVQNNPDGSVTRELQGDESQIDRVIQAIRAGRYVEIERMDVREITLQDERGFHTEY